MSTPLLTRYTILLNTRYTKGKALVSWAQYANGRTAMQLLDPQDRQPLMVATVNIPEYDVPAGHVLIKDWSENSGVLDALVDAEIVERTGITVPTGHVEANLCKLLVTPSGAA